MTYICPFRVIVTLLRSVYINNSDQESITEICLEEGKELNKKNIKINE
jgi:hypothetical protein